MKKGQETPNPNGKNGNPISLAPYSFDDALRKILSAKPEPKTAKTKPTKKRPSKQKR